MTPLGDVFEPGGSELEELGNAQARQRQLFVEMARRLRAAKVVVMAARVYVSTGRDRAGYAQLQHALEEFDQGLPMAVIVKPDKPPAEVTVSVYIGDPDKWCRIARAIDHPDHLYDERILLIRGCEIPTSDQVRRSGPEGG